MFTAPTAVRAIKKEDPEGNFIRKHDLSRFEALFLAGERTDPATVNWVQRCTVIPPGVECVSYVDHVRFSMWVR